MSRTYSSVLVVCAWASLACAQTSPPDRIAADPVARRTPDAQAKAVEQAADALIAGASSATEAALNWLAEHGARLRTDADSARTGAEQRLRQMVADALAAIPSAPTGVRLLAPGAVEGQAPRWTSLPETGALPAHMVLLVHGLDEPGSVWDDLAPLLEPHPPAVARFDFADDQPLAQDGDEFLAALKDLRARGVTRVDLVCHSMGGLIARDVLTRPAGYAGDARGGALLPDAPMLIMLGTPNQGSHLARLRYFAEAREHLCRWIDSDTHNPAALLGFLKDGSGEAGADLLPGSAYLTDLNARPLPGHVAITIVVGVIADDPQDSLKAVLAWPMVRSALGDREATRLARLIDEAAGAVGDGCVTADSALLPGVDDVVYVESAHRLMVKRPSGETALRQAVGEKPRLASSIPVILDRLSRE